MWKETVRAVPITIEGQHYDRHSDGNSSRTPRFARNLVARELGIVSLIPRGVRVLANGDDLTDSTTRPAR
jgi:hypothetical protein